MCAFDTGKTSQWEICFSRLFSICPRQKKGQMGSWDKPINSINSFFIRSYYNNMMVFIVGKVMNKQLFVTWWEGAHTSCDKGKCDRFLDLKQTCLLRLEECGLTPCELDFHPDSRCQRFFFI